MSKREYNTYRNKVNDQIRSNKRNYFHCLLHKIKNDIEKTWSTINNVLRGSYRKNKIEIKSIVFIDITYNDETYIPQIFNQYFTSIAKNMKITMPDPPAGKSFSDYTGQQK